MPMPDFVDCPVESAAGETCTITYHLLHVVFGYKGGVCERLPIHQLLRVHFPSDFPSCVLSEIFSDVHGLHPIAEIFQSPRRVCAFLTASKLF